MCDGGFGNLILTGFMGTGKTAVGEEIARRLDRPFVDMDAVIQARARKPIPDIFAQDGEAAFRRMEAALCEELSKQQGLIIATGGGALVDSTNRELMMNSGTVVCLTCDGAEILRRVSSDRNADRPLLIVEDPQAEIERLLKLRRDAYAAIPWQIDTTGLVIEEITLRILELAGVITLPVRQPGGAPSPSNDASGRSEPSTYHIHIGEGQLAHVGGALRAAGVPDAGRVAVVANPKVAQLYGDQLTQSLDTAGLRPFACSMPDGEQHKTLATVSALYDQFLAGGLDRSGTVVALGGGVTGDVAGFAAASFMRGVRFAQVPTTLLAMVDASVGGKTGVDLPQGKNLVGAFKQPILVVIDPSVLATLPAEEVRSGLAEVIKHGVIGAADLFGELETENNGRLSSWWEEDAAARIAHAVGVKIAVVEQDPYEKGRRAVLNLGHTVGHALEKLSGFALRHGEAVAIGIVAAARIAAKLGMAHPSLAERIEAVLKAWGLPTACPPFATDDILEAMQHDKKRQGRGLRWILPTSIGNVEIIEDIPVDIVKTALRSLGARSDR